MSVRLNFYLTVFSDKISMTIFPFHPSVYLSWYIFRCCSTAFLFASVYLSFLYVCPSVSFVHLFIYVWPFSYLSVCLSNLPSSLILNDLGCPTLQPEQQTKHKKKRFCTNRVSFYGWRFTDCKIFIFWTFLGFMV